MTASEKFQFMRDGIVTALEAADIDRANIFFDRNTVPRIFPAAFVVLQTETGTHATARQYRDVEIGFTIYLIANAAGVADPDTAIHDLKEAFRSEYIDRLNRDLPTVEYYPAKADGREVRIAKISTRGEG